MKSPADGYPQEKQQKSYILHQERSENGAMKEISNVLEKEEEDLTDIMMSNLSLKLEEQLLNQKKQNLEEKYAIVEFPQEVKKMISKDKNSILKKDIQPMNSLKTLEVVLTLRGKELKPFWNTRIEERSKNLWLPTKTDCVDLDLNFSNLLFQNFQKEESLFSITVQSQKMKNLYPIFFPLSMSFQQESMDYENIKQVFKPSLEKKFLRTMRVRLFPTLKQKNILNMWFGVYRRFYNEAKRFSEVHDNTCSFRKVRNGMRSNGGYEIPNKWKENKNLIPERIRTGAIKDFCSDLKGNLTKIKERTINHFEIHGKRKKDLTQTLNLEKQCFSRRDKTRNTLFPNLRLRDPTKDSGISKGLNIRGFYKKGKERIKLCDIDIDNDCRISYENSKFFLLVPYYKEEEKSNPNHSVISIDSGIRTFQTGYCPEGHSIEICKDSGKKLEKFYSKLDDLNKKYFDTRTDGSFTKNFKEKRTAISKRRRIIFEKIRNIVDNIHWKTVKFLTTNYKDIIISDFKVKDILRLKELRNISKRVLSSLSHYKFRQRLIEKCNSRGNYLCIFDESYTSKTCSRCGRINQSLGAKKIFSCSFCDYVSDRDISAGRNILLKTLDFLNISCPLCYTGVN
jgi:putative transposase